MVVLSVLYPKTSESTFDLDYYIRTHVPLVRSRWSAMGLRKIDLVGGTAALDGSGPTYELIGQVAFDSGDDLERALSQHGSEILADIPNFTNVQPILQVGKVL